MNSPAQIVSHKGLMENWDSFKLTLVGGFSNKVSADIDDGTDMP